MIHKLKKSSLIGSTVLPASMSLALPGASAHGDTKPNLSKPAKATAIDEHVFGLQGNPKKVSRTITVDMTDMMRFTPADITVK